jgi:hypothetical protein
MNMMIRLLSAVCVGHFLLVVASSQSSHKLAAPLWGCLPPAGWQHVLGQVERASSAVASDAADANGDHLGYMLANFSAAAASGSAVIGSDFVRSFLEGATHYRLVPGIFMNGIDYHFDGLATVFKFTFNATHVTWMSRPYDSNAYRSFDKCIFFGSGSGPTKGLELCFNNPGVNLLPIAGQLWLTIDTFSWGRVAPDTLETIPAIVDVPSTILNAHPACDPRTGECFVEHPCGPHDNPATDKVCVSQLRPGGRASANMMTHTVSTATLPADKLLQHSHSPCVTANWVVVKLDSFVPREPVSEYHGVLKVLQQAEDNLWLAMNRSSGQSRILRSVAAFVNNHFWNCYEDNDSVVVETVATTSVRCPSRRNFRSLSSCSLQNYLDNYFAGNLSAAAPKWLDIFQSPLRCHVPFEGLEVSCSPLSPEFEELPFDYPTFNPLMKMQPYRYFYAIQPRSLQSRWFDSVIKVDVQSSNGASCDECLLRCILRRAA